VSRAAPKITALEFFSLRRLYSKFWAIFNPPYTVRCLASFRLAPL